MVTGLYGSLAASASVFIGILTALLTSKLTSLRSERGRIANRLARIESRIENLKTQRENIEEELGGVTGPSTVKQLRQRNQRTIPPIPDRFKDPVAPAHVNPPSESEKEEVEEWRKYNQQVASNYNLQLENVDTEIDSLKQEKDRLEDRYESLDYSDLQETLKASGWAIGLAVFVPLLLYFLRATDLTFIPAPVWTEAGLVFVSWAFGLGYVLYHIRDQIQDEDQAEGLPDEPDLEQDGSEEQDPSEQDLDSSDDTDEE